MHNQAYQLLGQWMVGLISSYFANQRALNSDKLFIKVTGVDDDALGYVLEVVSEAEERLREYYLPHIRTLAAVPGYEKYQCQAHETSTWLRNNTKQGSALLIFMNAESPEAQSLENIFTVDEARLLSEDGLKVLFQLLADKYHIYSEDSRLLQRFLAMYGQLSEPQLRTMLSFMVAVIQSTEKTMIDKIQRNLDQLQMFRDNRLSFDQNGLTRLRRNYQLSRLERDGRSLKKSEFVENVFQFIEKSDDHELWESVSPDEFLDQALKFIHGQSTELLRYEFDLISSVFMFKPGRVTLNDRIKDFKTLLETKGEISPDQEDLITDTLEAVKSGENPDKIQEFIDEFLDILTNESPKLIKDLQRVVNRLRQHHEYDELAEALLKESFDLLEESSEEQKVESAKFKLSIVEAQVGEDLKTALGFHLNHLEKLIDRICFDANSLENVIEGNSDQVLLQLTMYINGDEVSSREFSLTNLGKGKLSLLLGKFADDGHIPYLKEYLDAEIGVNIVQEVKGNVSGYIATYQEGVEEAYNSFTDFVNWYSDEINRALSSGLSNVDYDQLEKRLEELLGYVHQSALVARYIIQYVGLLGAYDKFNNRSNDTVGFVQTRILTLLNPIRLLSYAQRLKRVQHELNSWISRLHAGQSLLDDMNAYLQQLQYDMSRLSPNYFKVVGTHDKYLIEQQEVMGEGIFTTNDASSSEEQVIQAFVDEFESAVKSYLEVYPYAKDCLDIVILYCPNATFPMRAIEKALNVEGVQKLKVIVHSENRGATIFETLNAWISQNEHLSKRIGSFPKVDVQVIAEQDINKLMNVMNQHLQDADIGILINYFGQSSHVHYQFERVEVKNTEDWFKPIYREPVRKDNAVKRINLVSEELPVVMQRFYQLQYVLHSNGAISEDEHMLVRNVISINTLSDESLLNFMHERFVWSLFIDRYLDKPLLRHVSSKAQIIKYKSSAGQNKSFKTILSSSKYVRKLTQDQADHEYFDRLYRKYCKLLKNDLIDRNIIIQAVEKVKEISGAIVLKAIGPGKFAHELIAVYLSTQARPAMDGELVIWSVCDELPWFNGSNRRPDLVRTSIRKVDDRISLNFELIELKFISDTIFEKERYDAIKQIKAGLELYRSRFLFNENPSSGELWRKEMINHFIECGTYSPQDAMLLREMQGISLESVDVTLTGSIDTFVYTSNLLELNIMEGHQNGYKQDILDNQYINHIYNRYFILNKLGAVAEQEIPVYGVDFVELSEFIADKLGEGEVESEKEVKQDEQINMADAVSSIQHLEAERDEAFHQIKYARLEAASGSENSVRTTEPTVVHEKGFPEQLALVGIPSAEAQVQEDIQPLVQRYQSKLRSRLNEIGIPIKILDSIVGVSVIRLIIELTGNTSFSSIKSRAEDIQMWLELSYTPQIVIRAGKVNIDINRENPEVVYFERFMEKVREQIPADAIKGKLVAPLGIGQLGEIIKMDFSSPETPHLLIGGRSGSGKSVTINSIILSMMCLYSPKEVQFIFIDPKRVEFIAFKNLVHTQSVITDIEEAVEQLDRLVEEMERRYELMAVEGATSLDQYIEVGGVEMPRLVVVFDEFADFMSQDKKQGSRVENSIMRLGQKARAAGIHLLICTQSPKADIISTNIRNNLGARLALRAADQTASRIILDDDGAERLGGKGDFLAKIDLPDIVRGKSPYLTTTVKKALLNYFRTQDGQTRKD
ncbi:DNA translocase (Stage III sporulation protein E) [Thermobacillus xylanilyticus]|jgi:S-DNA-T family DNA segregation ATPase FtsK/SpoIIIE|uniref:DNA translocase (Stage III sporulation protein E) n=1 Tax=Thermobacillus xylanilyticus TaxID=76633 RepID=A0ABN7RZK9_THEXY|nr:FtsK/SpoIIIE domain-containing protein [Thermobacillus xylanilyticus]CAG5087783.1 DNA translocase (Stage III sporulation protein E) [Thermobacillus xylanilyticus]